MAANTIRALADIEAVKIGLQIAALNMKYAASILNVIENDSYEKLSRTAVRAAYEVASESLRIISESAEFAHRE